MLGLSSWFIPNNYNNVIYSTVSCKYIVCPYYYHNFALKLTDELSKIDQTQCYCLFYSWEWDTEKYTVRYFPYLHLWRYRSRDFFEREISQFFAWDYNNKQNITRWLEDMTLIFSCLKQYFTHSLRSFVRLLVFTTRVKVISSRRRVISYIYLCDVTLSVYPHLSTLHQHSKYPIYIYLHM
jgi:hypothetical protein